MIYKVFGIDVFKVTKLQGNATLEYSVLPDYLYSDEIFLADPSVFESSIAPGETKKIEIVFRPNTTNAYSTELSFHSKLSTKSLLIRGQGN